MKTRSEFLKATLDLPLSVSDRAVALLWYYRQTQEYDERSASDLARDLHDEGFAKPNTTRLSDELRRSRLVVRGKRPGTFQLDVRRIPDLDKAYTGVYGARTVKVSGTILPTELATTSRLYINQMCHQINGAYECGFYDACAVMCRRLMESLVIDVYISRKRHHEIQHAGTFLPLERLLAYLKGDSSIPLSRSAPKAMDEVKELGDTAAHDRTYITRQPDIEEMRLKLRKLVSELLILAGIKT